MVNHDPTPPRIGDRKTASMGKFGLWVVFGSLVTTVSVGTPSLSSSLANLLCLQYFSNCPVVSQKKDKAFVKVCMKSNKATQVRKEFYLYPFISLVSDFGDSLGLFVGFSFFGLWDLIQPLLHLGNLSTK